MLKSTKKTIMEALGRGPIHPFPARMAAGIALDVLGESQTPLRVLDPMAGSGTVLAVARANGHRAFGRDLDPLAVLLADVWTRTVDYQSARDEAEETLSRARSMFRTLPVGQAYPAGSDAETQEFIRYWFDDYARRQLTALSEIIGRVEDDAVRNVFWASFSRLIITKTSGASLAMDLSHSRPHRAFTRAPVKPFDGFLAAVRAVVANCPQRGFGRVGPAANIKYGDARNLGLPRSSIDLVLTSPPYLNAIDYMRCSKFSLVWMGYNISELRKIRGESVGAEAASKEALEDEWVSTLIEDLKLKPALSRRDTSLLARYAWDMNRSLAEASRVLREAGKAVYVVGDSTIRGTFVRNSEIVSAAADKQGLVLKSRRSRALPDNRRYLPPPKRNAGAALDARMRHEIVLEFSKRSPDKM